MIEARDILGHRYPLITLTEEDQRRWDMAIAIVCIEMYPYIDEFPASLVNLKAGQLYHSAFETGEDEEVTETLSEIRAAGGLVPYLRANKPNKPDEEIITIRDG
ncbi:MAG: hypothetical protein H0X39_20415 [Actinobacteria bacterium]|nr:hypothetical protein [Actinomycetota bacterium]